MQKEIFKRISNIIKKVVLSKSNVIQWEKTACKTIENLYDIFPFQTFFCVFCDKEVIVHCFHVKWLKNSQKRRFVQKIIVQVQRYYKNFDSNNLNIYFHKLDLSNDLVPDHQIDFVLEKPSFGGLIGVGFVCDEKHENKCLAEIVLSIMALVIGSTKELATTLIELEKLAGSDPLTGTYNRKIFKDIVKKEIAFAKRQEVQEVFSLVCFDLDNFKQVNDVYGHLFGDLYLNKFVELIKLELRESDICARLGGDEFAVLLRQCDAHNAKRIVERIKRKTENFILKTDNGDKVKLEFSAGISEFPVHGTKYSQLYNIADSALYIAKQSGKGLICIGRSNGNPSDKFMQKQKDLVFLEKIIFEKKVIPFFQPILNVQNGLSVVGYEVLMRFLSLNGTPVPAGKYIDLAEQSGKIINLGKIVLTKALKYKIDKKISTTFFLNLSPKEIKNQYYMKWLLGYIEDLGIKSEEICFEITERESLGSVFNIQRSIYMLLEKGFKIAIDDFGSGYSNFEYITIIKPDYIKIDGSLISKMLQSQDVEILVKHIVLFSKELNIKTVAEFVSSEEILKKVKELGVDYGQGFYLGRPTQFS